MFLAQFCRDAPNHVSTDVQLAIEHPLDVSVITTSSHQRCDIGQDIASRAKPKKKANLLLVTIHFLSFW